jgi:heptosyltransferase-2
LPYLLLTFLAAPLLFLLIASKRKPAVMRRILVIQTAKIGDMVCTSPVFRELKRHYPQLHLAVLVHPITQSLVAINPHIDRVITLPPQGTSGFSGKLRLWRTLREGHYDAVLALNPSVPFAVCALWALIPRRLSILPNFMGSSYRLAARLWSDTVEHRGDHLIMETYLSLLHRLGVEGGSITKEVDASVDADLAVAPFLPKDTAPLIGIAISSANKLKALGVEKLAAVSARLLAETTAHIVLIGAAQDNADAQHLIGMLATPERVLDTTGQLSLTQLPALLKRLSLFIGVDSGVTYMADALNVPLVSIAGPCDMRETRPIQARVMIIQKTLPCAPCAHIYKAPYDCKVGTRECVLSVSTDEILQAALAILSAAPQT